MKTHFIFSLATGLLLMVSRPMAVATEDYAGQLMRARLFPQPLLWVGTNAPSQAESYKLYQAAGLDAAAPSQDIIGALDGFVQAHPDSPWIPSLEANLARYYRTQGRYNAALEYWQKAWQATKNADSPRERAIADYTLAYWSQLLSSLGRVDELEQLIKTVNGRPLSSPEFQQQFDRARRGVALMKQDPGVSFRCGTLALYHVAKALGITTNFLALADLDSPATGFSLAQLVQLSARYQLGLTAVKRLSGNQLVTPSVVHWKETHYAAIVARRSGAYQVIDPTFGRPQWLSADTINENASGYFLVPAGQVPPQWQLVSSNEAQTVFGKGINNGNDPAPAPPTCEAENGDPCLTRTCPTDDCVPGSSGDGGNGNGTSGGGSGGGGGCGGRCGSAGMADWEIQEPYISLWLHDRPMVYNMSFGRQFVLQMDYHQRETRPYANGVFNFGPNWNCNLLTYMFVQGNVVNGYYEDDSESCWDLTLLQWNCCAEPITNGGFQVAQYCPDGGERDYPWDDISSWNTVDPRSHNLIFPYTYRTSFLTNICDTLCMGTIDHFASNIVIYPNGTKATFDKVITVSSFPEEKIAFLTSATDPQGHVMKYFYLTNNNDLLLTQVVDFDGKTNLFFYGNASYPTAVTQITNTACGLAVNFSYDANGYLTNIMDVMGISSSFQYTATNDIIGYWANGSETVVSSFTNAVVLLTALKTPYGTTSFDYFRPTALLWGDTPTLNINRAITVSQPDGGKNLFLYRDNTLGYDDFYPLGYRNDSPNSDFNWHQNWFATSTSPGEQTHDNSHYWGPRQYANLSTTVLTNLQWNDFWSARVRNWLHTDPDESPIPTVAPTLAAELEFNPDPQGSYNYVGESDFIAQDFWYGYQGKVDGNPACQSTSDNLPSGIGYMVDSGGAFYAKNITRNSFGHPTFVVDFGVDLNGNTFARTNLYNYASNDIDLVQHIGPAQVLQETYVYDNYHNVIAMTNAVGEVTRYTYNTNSQLTGITQPNGLQTTNIYGADGFLARQIVTGFSTNSYTYTNGLVYTHTDERGLTVTNAWDKLQRLIKVTYPDGTSIAYVYSNLDLVRVVDRMGFTTGYNYDPMERRTEVTNALGNVTHYTYCACGSLDSIVDAAGNTTSFSYDCAGRLTNTAYADGYSLLRALNAAGMVLNTTDSSGQCVENYYDPEMRLVGVTNINIGYGYYITAIQPVAAYAYDANDLVTNSIDANNVGIGQTYDNLHRLLTRAYPDGGVEKYGYTLNVSGLTSYTNQIGNVVLYGYDALNRKTNEVYVGVTTNRFAYNGAGDLLTLTDGKNQATTWGYDSFGRVTNKLDAAGNTNFIYKYDSDNRLTNRWSTAKGNTGYSYDSAGNLTHVTYPVSPAISLAYDQLNRLTNMVDAVGTTVYGYDAAGQLLSEDGPWPNDTVSYTYASRLRTGLSLPAPNASAWSQSYSYDTLRRLTNVISPAGMFGYLYDPVQAQRVDQLGLPNGAYITNTFDSNARLLSTILKNSGGTNLDFFTYGYNQANQRTSVVRTAGDYVNYTYDNEGELTSALGKEAGGTTNRWQEQFGYAYDAAGNLNHRTNNTLLQAFNVNNLNELTSVTNGGRLTVSGAVTGPATNVTVNTSNAVLYADAAFASSNQPWANGNNTFTAIARDGYGRRSTNSITVNLAATNTFAYDLNGNLLTNGNEVLVWNDENELVTNFVAGSWKSEFVYDGKMRRRIERDYTWNGSLWLKTNEVHYIYDGNIIFQQRDGNNLPALTLTRGNDSSGSLQGAGGIGGILAMTENSAIASTHSYFHADGNGNVTMLIGANQISVAKAEYDPFGNLLSLGGPKATVNSYWYSSKPIHWQSGRYDYLYRWYAPQLDRWPNRDPIDEWGGFNLYRFVRNTPTCGIDAFGLSWWRGLPILNLVSCFSSEPGGNTADYASIPSPSCQDCKSDPDAAEAKCDEAVNAMESGYLGNAAGPMLLDGLGDGIVVVIGLRAPPVLLGLIPNGIATACEMKNLMNISKAAGDYKNKYCKCSQGK